MVHTPAATSGDQRSAAARLASEIKRLRGDAGLSQPQLARQIGYSRQYVSLAERAGQNLPSVDLVRSLDKALKASGALLALREAAKSEQLDRRSSVRSENRMATSSHDRDALGPAKDAATNFGSEDVIDVLNRVQQLHRSTVQPEVIAQLRDSVQHALAHYETLEHSSLVPALLKQHAGVEALLKDCGHPVWRQQLYAIAGTTSGLLGYVAVGRSDFSLARAYCLEAFQLGDYAQNSNLQAWARGIHSFCEYYAGRFDEALGLAKSGLSYANSGPQSVRLTINGAARAMGKLGDMVGVDRTVADAYDLMSRNDVPNGFPSSISQDCYSAAQTAGNAATAYVSLGIPEKVRHYVDLALPDINKSDSSWSQSLVLIDVALSHIRSKESDLDYAAAMVLDGLRISSDRPIVSIRQRTSEFVRDAVERWGNTRQTDEICDAVSSVVAR